MISTVDTKTVCVIGLGYVGLPLAESLSRSFKVIGFDNNEKKVGTLASRNGRYPNLVLTTDPSLIRDAGFIIICVPTPVTAAKEPDLSFVTGAAATAGKHMSRGTIVVLESTVYPGVTEDVVRPILEKASGMGCGRDFKIGYSPERINPGDSEHTVDTTVKVVSGMDEATAQEVADLYRRVAPRVFVAKNIKTAEACKVVENTQRDLNIALINELAMICEKIGIDVNDVLDAASTKWNFHRYSPGLVGGHCIPVVPYFLVHRAAELGYEARLILAGRVVNDGMARHVAKLAIKALNDAGKVIKDSRVLIMGLTYKENVPDIRETQVRGVIAELGEFGVEVYAHDPLLQNIGEEFHVNEVSDLKKAPKMDAVILAVSHDQFRGITLAELKAMMSKNPVLVDVKRTFDRAAAQKEGFLYRTL